MTPNKALWKTKSGIWDNWEKMGSWINGLKNLGRGKIFPQKERFGK